MHAARFGISVLALGLVVAGGPVAAHAADTMPDADNSARNVRDRNDTLTPLDQGTSEADRGITQRIRQDVMKQDGFSMNAQNVKIITMEGVVTLRGPVATPQEKATIASLAQKTAGVKRVDNQLEVEAHH